MKKLHQLLVIAVAALVFCGFSMPVSADSTQYAYRAEDGSVEIVACYSQETYIEIPATLDEMPVDSIASGAFSTCGELTTVYIPDSVKEIGTDIFPSNGEVKVTGVINSAAHRYCQENNIDFGPGEATASLSDSDTVFPDVPANQWYAPYVQDLHNQGIVNGDEKGLFNPGSNTTRAEFVKMLATASKDDLSAYQGQSQFNDVATNQWYTPYIAWAADKEIVNGYGDGSFKPLGMVTRAEMMVMQKRYGVYVNAVPLPIIVNEMVFSDAEDIDSWCSTEIKELQMAGIINGKGGNLLAPGDNSTRAEAAKMISAFISLINKDNSQLEIKGLMFMADETSYWLNGSINTSSQQIVSKSDTLMVPLSIYSQYLNGTISEESGNATRMTLSDGGWVTVTQGTSTASTSTGETIPLKQATYLQGGQVFVDIFSLAAFCGDTAIVSADGTAYIIYPQGRTIVQENWLLGSSSLTASKIPRVTLSVTSNSYGSSGQGRNLTYTAITPSNYTKTVMLVFEQHGFEDSYAKDGQVLVNAANTVVSHFSHLSVDDLNKTRIVVVTSANPDGLAEGYTNNGPGRCTVVGGVDMNRDWPTSNYQRSTEARYYTLNPLSCNETRNLNNLITIIKPNILLDIHGWLNGTYGDRSLAAIFNQQMGLPYKTLFSSTSGLNATDVTYLSDEEVEEAYLSALVGFRGYLAGYCHEQGIRSALVELRSPGSPNTDGLIRSINTILETF